MLVSVRFFYELAYWVVYYLNCKSNFWIKLLRIMSGLKILPKEYVIYMCQTLCAKKGWLYTHVYIWYICQNGRNSMILCSLWSWLVFHMFLVKRKKKTSYQCLLLPCIDLLCCTFNYSHTSAIYCTVDLSVYSKWMNILSII